MTRCGCKRKLHLLNWDEVTKPKSHGGLGLKDARNTNKVHLGKLVWNFKRNPNSIWAKALARKYGQNLNAHITSSSPNPKAMKWENSLVEQRLVKTVFSSNETLKERN
ncbi:putative ribonuclease H protein [Corchorus olitorius]|uniref:Ribonuclease H protein n=1 Tax=Corchorus olitorius TaxID=93759 RepID=A0A1R3G9X2_9ROSI|nr:putative ribonuclease H protein [Corchorus olitorius]